MSGRAYEVRCPGCKERIHAFNQKSIRRHMKRHAADCDALRRLVAHGPTLRVENVRADP